MSRTKFSFALVTILGLGGFCLYVNRDSFSSPPIQISHRVSPSLPGLRPRRPGSASPSAPVVFSFDTYHRFTDIKVFIAAETETNKYAHPLWSLVTDSNSIPTATFAYGSYVRGMRPAVKGARPDALDPGVKYRLRVRIGDRQAEHDFALPAKR